MFSSYLISIVITTNCLFILTIVHYLIIIFNCVSVERAWGRAINCLIDRHSQWRKQHHHSTIPCPYHDPIYTLQSVPRSGLYITIRATIHPYSITGHALLGPLGTGSHKQEHLWGQATSLTLSVVFSLTRHTSFCSCSFVCPCWCSCSCSNSVVKVECLVCGNS